MKADKADTMLSNFRSENYPYIISYIRCVADSNQFKELIDLFHSEECFLDIICLTEIWNLKDNDFYNLEHYNFVSKMRRQSAEGGVAYHIKKVIRYKEEKEAFYKLQGDIKHKSNVVWGHEF